MPILRRSCYLFRMIGRCFCLTICIISFVSSFACFQNPQTEARSPRAKVATLAGAGETRFGEVFGIAVDDAGKIFVSDGQNGKIFGITPTGKFENFIADLDTPSGLAFDKSGNLFVADAGKHVIWKIDPTSEITRFAGVEGKSGFADGAVADALFNAPVGVAVGDDGRIFVADTYNDRIRVIENGSVRTLAGGGQGFADSSDGLQAKFDTPCGVAVLPDGVVLVADTGNSRIRRIETSGAVATFAGTGERESRDGFAFEAAFVEPVGIAVDHATGAIFVADAGANRIRVFGQRFAALWETLSGNRRGLTDENLGLARFNRPTNLTIDRNGNVFVADSANKLVRVVQAENQNIGAVVSPDAARNQFLSIEQMRAAGEPRWTYDPPDRPRDIAGTFGELRGEIRLPTDFARFHNGLDIAGALGETARFVRGEKVLLPIAVENFDASNNRELIRMPTIGYIHIRLGRDASGKPFEDKRFLFSRDESGKLTGLRVPRGARFRAGEAVGTLNPLNHVHLIAGETGAEMNALAGLELPGARDTLAPKIEKIILFDENWREIKLNETVRGKLRIVVQTFDQMDGGSARRRLGVYRLGYEISNADGSPLAGFERRETISFERLPENEAANLVYAVGSASGATGTTIFNYVVSNFVRDGAAREDFLDTAALANGVYKLRVFAADFFGNEAIAESNLKVQN
jgi:DNA-binding beta-propeller fold protein YncE